MEQAKVHRDGVPAEEKSSAGAARAERGVGVGAGPAGDDTPHLTRAVAGGDREAFGVFYDRWFDWSYARVRKATGRDEEFCLDVVHDAMLKVIRSMTTMPNRAVLNAWLSRVLLNTARDRIKVDARRARRERAHAEGRARVDAPAHAGSARRDELAALDRELGALDEALAGLVTARVALGMTLERAGALFGLGTGSTDRRVRKALAALRESMTEEDG